MGEKTPVDRLRVAAELILAIGTGTLEEMLNELEDAAGTINDIADDLQTTTVVPQRLCAKKASGRNPDMCDRPHAHLGRCSWEAAILARRIGDYEAKVALIPGLRQEANVLRSDLRRANEQLNELVLEAAAMRQPRR